MNKLFFKIFYKIIKLKLFNKFFKPVAIIFTLHRVQEIHNNELPLDYSLKVSPQFLENLILYYKNLNYEFISLDDLHYALLNKLSIKNKILFTLDDGYLDNYVNAYPIFKKHNIPFTIFVCTSFPDKKIFKWWLVLERIIFNSDYIILNNGETLDCSDINQKIQTFFILRERIMSVNMNNIELFFHEMFINYSNYFTLENTDLTWDNIKILSQDSLVTIGGHTVNHKPLKKQSYEESFFEIEQGNKIIEDQIGIKVNHFAYPFGSLNECSIREFKIISKCKLKTAVTTINSPIYSIHRYFLSSLPRINLTENFDYFNYN